MIQSRNWPVVGFRNREWMRGKWISGRRNRKKSHTNINKSNTIIINRMTIKVRVRCMSFRSKQSTLGEHMRTTNRMRSKRKHQQSRSASLYMEWKWFVFMFFVLFLLLLRWMSGSISDFVFVNQTKYHNNHSMH